MSHHDTHLQPVWAGDESDGRRPRLTVHIAELTRVALIGIAGFLVGLHVLNHVLEAFVGWGSLLVGGWPVWREALESLRQRRMTMELSMSIAIVAAAAIGELFTALVITGFVLVAEILEDMTVDRGRRAISDLLDLLPRTVVVRRDGGLHTIPAEELQIGETVFVAPGSSIPVDGTVEVGHSFVDQAGITGESIPVEKTPGDRVYAGTVNQAGALEVRTEGIGRDTSYGRIIETVERAERSRAPVQRLADRLAGYLVYFALAAAAVTFLLTRDIRSTISVVIVAGACGIAAGTPLAILGGIGRAARLGVIIKGGVHLETLGKVDTVVLDKTGTLTFGTPLVHAVVPADGHHESTVIEAAATAELRSEHPLGKAIVEHARNSATPLVEPDSFHYTPGRGVDAGIGSDTILAGNQALMEDHGVPVPDQLVTRLPAGSSHVLVARGHTMLGAIAISDSARPEARHAVTTLQQHGIKTILLTGDNQPAATAIGRSLGITEIEAGLLPDQKLDRIQTLVEAGNIVAMVGDGINDAPALLAANVGVAMGSGTDIAHESGDVLLIGNDLTRFVDALALAQHARIIIYQNFAGTIGIDLAGIGLAAFGLLNPVLAALVHVTSELAFLLNSARLLPSPQRRRR